MVAAGCFGRNAPEIGSARPAKKGRAGGDRKMETKDRDRLHRKSWRQRASRFRLCRIYGGSGNYLPGRAGRMCHVAARLSRWKQSRREDVMMIPSLFCSRSFSNQPLPRFAIMCVPYNTTIGRGVISRVLSGCYARLRCGVGAATRVVIGAN